MINNNNNKNNTNVTFNAICKFTCILESQILCKDVIPQNKISWEYLPFIRI